MQFFNAHTLRIKLGYGVFCSGQFSFFFVYNLCWCTMYEAGIAEFSL